MNEVRFLIHRWINPDGERSTRPLFLFLTVGVIISMVCSWIDPSFYSKILGNLNPMIVFPASGAAGYLSLVYLQRFGLYFISSSITGRKLLFYFSISIILGGMPVLIDIWQNFPKDIHVLFPESLLFYPTIGLLAEIIFHLLPTTLLHAIFRSKIKNHSWMLILLVAAVEPFFQVVIGTETNQIVLRDVLVFLEVFIFGIVQMKAFLKYGFLAMFICRMGFYLTWHFIWGTMRLEIIW